MTALAGEKRKNDERRGVPWWLLLLVGFALGIIFTLSVSIGRSGTSTMIYASDAIPNNLATQTTLTVLEATLRAQAAQNHQIAGQLDPVLATATAIVQEATRAAVSSGT